MSNHLTLHIVASIPFSNLNRDDAGTPKNIRRGGVTCALLSSQSIKRGIRTKYETASSDFSVRSGGLVDEVVHRALEIAPEADKKTLKKEAKKLIGTLTKISAGDSDNDSSARESDRSIWLSQEELEVAAAQVAGTSSEENFIEDGKTGSLAVAAFGRMFAAAPQKGTEAALSVSPAVTTHGVQIATDYFSTVDDLREERKETGATYLGVAQYTNGVFYRTITIDKEQLRSSWTGFDHSGSEENLRHLIDAIIYGLPRGKQHSTAPFVQPAVILAEEQRYRCAYDFERPVQADSNHGGYLDPTITELDSQYKAARKFDAENFGDTQYVTGTFPDLEKYFAEAQHGSKEDLIDAVIAWIKA
ncbi:type I-E CRISPR-associated protein Cas7/Cse4/CasC [Corynebacterium sp. sy017]|uniref:type I-E CRISPR-associated protein Cas7/Cse4/CasC n=1 Tax=unclassified Corynebacterium TaxID=2624378 RepID=UPI001184DD93|nr:MULTISPECIES: type I-E CRISPR-associated protein Cas7/Cse4/CasC [unclassified Corynebacterium]MBP3088480.1 type I-E CRISPR-associated protein Cas7/Cse4/CasC [Corynebacterium sp. sy017]TSD91788.1 type I-E CRISPR-associated protein Cas7/Cse4/CasC [Corynebacterium sp. SY003]